MASLVVILQFTILLAMVIGNHSGGYDGGMKKAISSLTLGMFGLGVAEFSIMDVLTELAHDVGILIPIAGHIILYYVLGMVVDAPIIALFSSCYSPEHILLFLVALYVIGNAVFTLSSSYLVLAISRLVSDLPHDVFFGVGAIMLSKIIEPGKVIATMTGVVSGMTVISLLDIPLRMHSSQEFSWCYTFLLIVVFNITVMVPVYFWVSDIHDEVEGKLREQSYFLRSPAPWLIFAVTMFGNAGMFAQFNYVRQYMMFISGFSETAMIFIMMLAGLGIALGNMLSGRIPGRYPPLHIAVAADFIIVLTLLMLFFFDGMKTMSLIFVLICCAGLFALSTPLRVLLLQNAKGGELLGVTGGQVAFNLGSVVGACYGGMMLTLGLAYNYVALLAALPSFAAMSSLLLYGCYKRQQAVDSSVLAKPLGQIAVAVHIACCRM